MLREVAAAELTGQVAENDFIDLPCLDMLQAASGVAQGN